MAGPTDYDDLAARYGAGVDDRPWNALYERPSTIALLPSVAGKDVLDAGCGSGWYTEWLVRNGAQVVGIDLSGRMLDLARQRLAGRAELSLADVSDLHAQRDGSFDLVVSSLVLHYVGDLKKAFSELARVLRPGGLLVFSTHHPFRESSAAEYLRASLIEEEWRWLGTRVRYYQRPLRDLTEPMAEAGFVIERLCEPSPSEALRQVDPDGYQRLCRAPAFLFVRARKS
jgi:SAM-dependent methyltransferase